MLAHIVLQASVMHAPVHTASVVGAVLIVGSVAAMLLVQSRTLLDLLSSVTARADGQPVPTATAACYSSNYCSSGAGSSSDPQRDYRCV